MESLPLAAERGILSNLSGADGNIARVARALGMSPRTLQRRLREEGVPYASLVDGRPTRPIF